MIDSDTNLSAFLRRASRVALSTPDKARIREALSQYADKPTPARFYRVRSPYLAFLSRPFPVAACLLLFVVLLGGGSAYAAQDALPGDALYPIKVRVTEPVTEALAFSTVAKANVEATIATTRLSEMQRLAAKGTLSTTTAAALSISFVGHTEAANANLAALVENDPSAAATISSSFDARIHADKTILNQLDASGDKKEPAVHAAVMLLSATSASSEQATSSVTTTPSDVSDTFFAALTESAQNALLHAQSVVATSTSGNGATTSVPDAGFIERAQAEVHTAGSEMMRATTTLAHGDKSDAYGAFMASLRSSVIAEAYATAAKNAGTNTFLWNASTTASTTASPSETTPARTQGVLRAADELRAR